MRQGQQNNKGMRNRNRNNRKGPNPLSRSYESNGGDVKIRGTALHVAEKYVQLARDAQSSGDRVAGENYLQHAEHYYRIVAAAQAQMPQPQQIYRNDDGDDEGEDDRDGNVGGYNHNYGGGGNPYQGNRPQQGGQQGGQYGGGQQGQPQGGGQQGQPQGGGQHTGGQGGQQGGGHAAYGIPEQPAYANGNNGNGAREQEAPEGGQPNEQRGDDFRNQGGQGGQGGQGPGGNNFRGRRRRPYRDQYNNNNNDRGPSGDRPPVAAPAPDQGGGGFDAQGDE